MGNGLRYKSEAEMPEAMRAQFHAQHAAASTSPIVIEIPIRTPTLNAWQRLHWSQRSRLARDISQRIALASPGRPAMPYAKCKVTVERHSTTEPDIDGLIGGMKPLLDALQPHSKRHPYGLGFIVDDRTSCMVDFRALHIKSREKRTRITIEQVNP